MKLFVVVFLLLLLILIACSQGYIINMNEKTEYPEGRDLFASKCSGCHRLPYPSEYTSTQWDSILLPMKKKAKLTDKQQLLILKWLTEKELSQ